MRAEIGLGNLCDSSIGPWTVWCSAWFPTQHLAVSRTTSRPLPPHCSLVAAWDLRISCRSHNLFQSSTLLPLPCLKENGTQVDLMVLVFLAWFWFFFQSWCLTCLPIDQILWALSIGPKCGHGGDYGINYVPLCCAIQIFLCFHSRVFQIMIFALTGLNWRLKTVPVLPPQIKQVQFREIGKAQYCSVSVFGEGMN